MFNINFPYKPSPTLDTGLDDLKALKDVGEYLNVDFKIEQGYFT